MIGPAPPQRSAEPGRRRGVGRYALAVAITVGAIVSQYVVPEALPATRAVYGGFLGNLSIVYGIPIVAFAALVGVAPLRNWRTRMGFATWEGLRWYGLLSGLGFLVLIALVIVYLAIDPSALQLLQRPNPVLESARPDPWFWVGFSFVIGAVEELIFRGWIYGFWRGRGGAPWWVPAIGTSALFAAVHLYYGFTYAAAAPLVFPDLFLLGFAFAATVESSGGNLVIVALLHGVNDAAAFLTLVSPGGATALHYGVIGIGLLIALITYARKHAPTAPPLQPFFAPSMGPPFGGDPYAYVAPVPPPPPPPPTSPPGPS